jgi:hypothetical protein
MRLFAKEFLEPFAYLVYAVAIFLRVYRYGNREFKLLFFYYVLVTILMFAAAIINTIDDYGNNNYLYNFSFLITGFVFAHYFYHLLKSNLNKKIYLI